MGHFTWLLLSNSLRNLGIEPAGRRQFLVTDGRRIEIGYGQVWDSIDGESVVTIVVFEQNDAPPLLGSYTLKGLALAVDPESQRPVPTRAILY